MRTTIGLLTYYNRGFPSLHDTNDQYRCEIPMKMQFRHQLIKKDLDPPQQYRASTTTLHLEYHCR